MHARERARERRRIAQVADHDVVRVTVDGGVRPADQRPHRHARPAQARSTTRPPSSPVAPITRTVTPRESRATRSQHTACASLDPGPASAESSPCSRSSRARCASSPTRAGGRTCRATSRGPTPRRRHVVQPVGHLVGGDPRLRHRAPRRRRRVVEGKWDVTPAVFLHTELHRARPDAAVIVHDHPYYATLLASMGETPRIVHQNSCIFDGELAFVDEYARRRGREPTASGSPSRSATRAGSCSRTTARS